MKLKAIRHRCVAALDRLLGFPRERRRFYRKLGYRLCLARPRSYNEKIVWRKLYDRNPLFPVVTDKWLVRGFACRQLGQDRAEKYLIPVHAVLESAHQLDAAMLDRPCVVKPTHASGDVLLLPRGLDRDIHEVRAIADEWLRKPPYRLRHHEWAYRQLKPRLIVEQYLVGDDGGPAADYKFVVINGRARMVQVHRCRFSGHRRSVFTRDWRHIEVDGDNIAGGPQPRPENYEEMLALAEELASPFDFMRVDMYNLDGRIYLGELTCYPASGKRPFDPVDFDFELGSHWQLPARRLGSRLLPHHRLPVWVQRIIPEAA